MLDAKPRFVRPNEWRLEGTNLRLVPDALGHYYVIDERYPGKYIGAGAMPLKQAKTAAIGFAARYPDRCEKRGGGV